MCPIFSENGVEMQTVNCVWYEHNMSWKGKEWTVSDMYRKWVGKANSELCLICTEHGLERQTENCVRYMQIMGWRG